MAEYTFTGATPRLLFGLAQGVNATLHPATPDTEPLADGQTIIARPGDRLTTDEDYPHAELEPFVPETPPATKTARTKA
jgi:hypothetical protein